MNQPATALEMIVAQAQAQGVDETACISRLEAWIGSSAASASLVDLRTFLDADGWKPDSDLPFHYDWSIGEGWVRVTGGSLTQAVKVRFGRKQGTYEMVPVALTLDNGEPISAATLRNIRLAKITDDVFRVAILDLDLVLYGVKDDDRAELTRVWQEVRSLRDAAVIVDEPVRHRRGATPPTDELLNDFARTFNREFLMRRHGAVTRTAKARSVARTTVYQWIELCRERNIKIEE